MRSPEVRAARPGVTNAEDGGGDHTQNRFRKKRFQMFRQMLVAHFSGKSCIRILDIGGARHYWEGLRPYWEDLPIEITIVNIGAAPFDDGPYRVRDGDACNLSSHADGSFDIVHSNSVIEHVGAWGEMAAMAGEVRRLSAHYYIQTPNFSFPLEPHFRTLFFHWYPEIIRAHLLTKKKRGFIEKEATLGGAMLQVQAINLITARQMAELFPDGEIKREMVFGFPKSLIAVR